MSSPRSLPLLRFASLCLALAAPAVAAAQGAPPSGPPPGAPPPGAPPASPYYQPTAAPPVGAPAPQLYAAPTAIPRRVGFELDIGLQGGEINCDSPNGECNGFTEAGGIDVGGTYMFTPRIGINAQVWAMAHSRGGWTLAQVITTVGIEFRPVPILSLQAGFGHAHASLSTDRIGGLVVSSDNAPAMMLGASLDLVRSRRWVIDLQAKFGQGFYGDQNNDGQADVVARNVGAGAGFTYLF